MMINNYKITAVVLLCMLTVGYIIFFAVKDFEYANAFLAGFIIIFFDIIILAYYLNKSMQHSSVTGFVLQSVIRWLFIGFCIYIALTKLSLYKWSFAVGIILPFVGVFITGIYYQISRGKEDGTSS